VNRQGAKSAKKDRSTRRPRRGVSCELICGDALDVLGVMPDRSIDMVFMDPSYGQGTNDKDLIGRWEAALGKRTTKMFPVMNPSRPIYGDDARASLVYRCALLEVRRLMRGGGCCCCCGGGGGPDPQFGRWSLWMDQVFKFKQMIVWDKGPMGMGWHYRRSYEVVLVGQIPGGRCKWYDRSYKVENVIRAIPKIIPQENDHPTVKPVALPAHFIRLHSRRGDIVCDPFMGSGTTGVAALKARRSFIGIEIDPHWCDVARKRIKDECGLSVKVRKFRKRRSA
jgi:DNA modification methylase